MDFWEGLIVVLSPIITIGVTLGGGLYAYARTAARSENNRDAIVAEGKAREKLEAEYKAALAKQEADYHRLISELKTEIANDLEVIHKRYDKHQEHLANALHELGVEIRGFHKEIGSLRETIAHLDSRNSQVTELADAMSKLPGQVAAAVKLAVTPA